MDHNKALSRIKKCLALSKSANEHEAAAALRQAQKLMTEFNLTTADIDGSEVGTATAPSTVCSQPPDWEVRLGHAIAEAFACVWYINLGWFDTARNKDGAKASIIYLGAKMNADTAAYAHDVIRRQLLSAKTKFRGEHATRHRANYGLEPSRAEKMAAGNSFATGYVVSVSKLLHKIAPDARLVPHIEAAKRAALGEVAKTAKVTRRGTDHAALSAGSAAGADTRLHRPMDGVTRLRQIN